MKPRISVLGSCNMDLVAYTARAPGLGETVAGDRFETAPGGKGANQAVAAARAGGRVSMIGAVGDDHYGARLRAVLEESGVGTGRVRTVAGPTGTAHITVDGSGANAIVVVPGANATVMGLDDADEAVIAASRALLLQLEVPLPVVRAGAAVARANRVPAVLTPSPARPLPPELLSDIDLIVANEHEATELGGDKDPLGGLLDLVSRAVVTLGPAGCVYGTRAGERVRVAAPAVPVVETTGAGDCFAGVLGVALAEGAPVEDALRTATAAATLVVQRRGAATAMPGRPEIDRFAAEISGAG
ncbi:ribokinase [Actinomadura craniellae]|uniref:Ribokinase n=1 Tax=Actinomadura craniellae TaxID=2231787 RepID=A0A365HBI2_9ACTN|nr:ribokinase [Actinomadura craniellae]RAY16457.1 ribokinase [Actinomadura craniellae]